MKVSRTYSCLFLFLLVLVIYFPSINGVVNSVDDIHILREYGINGKRTLQQILLPSNQFYFRPIVELTYYLDNLFWELEPSFMHLENVLLHATNVILVYLTAVEISALAGGICGFPFMSAVLFAVHPVNTEAVSWIAGRTDPLAAFFILISTLFLFKAFQYGRMRDLAIAFTSMLFSFLVKETAFMLLPVSVLFIYLVRRGDEGSGRQKIMHIRKWMVIPYLALLGGSGIYASARFFLKPAGSDNAFSMLLQHDFGAVAFIKDFIIIPGFYIKKLVFPFPLNFAIDSVSNWYIVPGFIVLLSCIYFLTHRNIVNSLIVAAILFVMPAVIVKFTGITWTPVAERYAYIPSAFFSMWISVTIMRLISDSRWKKSINIILIVLVCLAALFTYKRNLIWRSNLSLYQDAVDKSPEFGDIHNELGIALLRNGDIQSARKHFILAQQLSKRPLIREFASLNLLNCDIFGKTLYEQKNIILNYIDSRDDVQSQLRIILRNLNNQIIRNETDPAKRALLMKEVIVLNDRIFRELNDSHCLYSNGQLMLVLGDRKAALDYFRRTILSAPSDAYYFEPAKKLIRSLEKE